MLLSVLSSALRSPLLCNAGVIVLLTCFQERWRPIPSHGEPIAVVVASWACAFWLLVRLGVSVRRLWALPLVCVAVVNAWMQAPEANFFAFSHFMGLGYALPVMALAATAGVSMTWRRATEWVAACAGLIMIAVGLMYSAPSGKPLWLFAAEVERLQSLFPADLQLDHEGLLNGRINPNALGGVSVILLPLFGAILSHAYLERRWAMAGIASLGMAMALAATLLSGSTTALLTLGGLSAIAVARTWRFRNVVALGCLMAATVLTQVNVDEFVSAKQPQFDRLRTSLAVRIPIYQEALATIQSQPLKGIGLSQFRSNLRSNLAQSQSENVLLQTALDLGVFGATEFFMLLWQVLYPSRARVTTEISDPHHLATAGRYIIAAYLLFGVTDVVALGSRVGTLLWVGMGFALTFPANSSEGR